MTIETATYVSDLNESLPAATDPKSEGDDHLRLIKSALKNTFPGVTGAFSPWFTATNATYSSGSWTYTATGAASYASVDVTSGFSAYYASSGTAGSAITWSRVGRFDASGNLMLGNPSFGTTPTGMASAVHLPNGTAPGGASFAGGVLWVEGGALKFKSGTSGTTTTIAS